MQTQKRFYSPLRLAESSKPCHFEMPTLRRRKSLDSKMNNISLESLIKESVRQDLYEAAEKEMAAMKHGMVTRMVDKIQIMVQNNPVGNEVVIKVRLRGD